MFSRQKIAVLVSEFLAAAILSTVVLSMIGRTSFPFFVAIAAGLTVGAMAYLFGAHSNPAVTIGLWTMRKVQATVAIALIAAQMLGGFVAWRLNEYLIGAELNNIAGDFDWRILLAEALGAFVLGLGLAVAINRSDKDVSLPVSVGVALALGILIASFASNGLLNPAVAVGVQSWSWAYALGPILGVIVGVNLYGLLYIGWKLPKRSATKSTSVRSKVSARKSPAKKPARKATRARK